jgi:hypothetical protein
MELMQEPDAPEQALKRACKIAADSASWMKLLGVISIIQGVFAVFTIWGIVIAWLPIWLGVILFRAANEAEMAAAGLSDHLEAYLKRLNRFFLIQGILMLLMIVIALIMAFVMGGMFLLGGMLE